MEGNVVSAVSMTLCRALLFACVVLPYHTVMPAISELDVSLNTAQEQNLRDRGFKQIPKDLNKGASGNYIYLWYKEGPTAITKIQVTFTNEMAVGLATAGYTKINKDLNAGAGGDYIYLWYHHGSGEYDTPIVGLDVTTDPNNEAAKFGQGWERLTCDLNRYVKGNWIHLWVKRETQTYISEITATDSFGSDTNLLRSGYIRVDEDTNRAAGGSYVFIWYRQTTDPKRALTTVQVSTSKEEAYVFQQQGYTSVSVNLNEGTSGPPVHLWFKKEASKNPIKDLTLLLNTGLVGDYVKAGLIVITKDLNTGNDGNTEYVCVYQ